jgi:murein L,D-transpeptidase YafK
MESSMSPVRCALLFAVILAAPGPAVAGTGPLERVAHCARLEAAHVLVDTKDHKLSLCERGREVASYRVALGRAGTRKRVQGDDKTPLGSYALGAPRPSSRFGTFIPIAYPTREQRLRGFTGAAVGIHGPDRRFRWAGRLNAWFDWTAGCVALATDDEVELVAAWVQKRKPTVTIR